MIRTTGRGPLHFVFDRRQLLRASFVAAGAALAHRFGLARIAQAAVPRATTRRFIFCYFPGGWDQLLFLDPRDPRAEGGRYDDSNRATTLTETRYGLLDGYNGFASQVIRAGNLTFGPATEKPALMVPKLSQFYERIAIVRGINMATLAHEVGYRYFLTGKFPAGNNARGTSIPTEAAAQMGASTPLPVLALRIEAYNDRQPGQYNALRVDSVDDLLLVLNRGQQYLERDSVEEALDEYARRGAPCEVNVYDRRGILTRMREADATGREILRRGLASRFGFITGTDENSTAVRTQYGFARGDGNAPGARAAFAAQAIKQGVAQCVSVTIGNGTDTHFSPNTDHADRLYPGIAALAALIDDLSRSDAPEELQRVGGRKWIDHTTIFAFSEFARTPLFNQFGGRDHHLASSCLIAGAGIVGNQVVGASGEVGMGPGRYDFAARRPAPTGENIMPEHIAATLLASAGLDYSITRVRPLSALIPGE